MSASLPFLGPDGGERVYRRERRGWSFKVRPDRFEWVAGRYVLKDAERLEQVLTRWARRHLERFGFVVGLARPHLVESSICYARWTVAAVANCYPKVLHEDREIVQQYADGSSSWAVVVPSLRSAPDLRIVD